MEENQRKQLESRLHSVLGELSMLCVELGIALPAADGGSPSAPPPPRPATDVRRLQSGPVLLVRLGHLTLGFAASEVQELVRIVEIADSVEPRPELEGFVNLRGSAVPVVNLRHLLELPPVARKLSQILVILRVGDIFLAVVVDEVLDVYVLGPESFRDRDAMDLRAGFIAGVASVEDSLIAVLDPSLMARIAL